MGKLVYLSDRRPHTTVVPSQALAEAGVEVTAAGLRLAAFLGELAAANQGRPALGRRIAAESREVRDLVKTGHWLCAISDEDRAA
jgi:hypothetical protein